MSVFATFSSFQVSLPVIVNWRTGGNVLFDAFTHKTDIKHNCVLVMFLRRMFFPLTFFGMTSQKLTFMPRSTSSFVCSTRINTPTASPDVFCIKDSKVITFLPLYSVVSSASNACLFHTSNCLTWNPDNPCIKKLHAFCNASYTLTFHYLIRNPQFSSYISFRIFNDECVN